MPLKIPSAHHENHCYSVDSMGLGQPYIWYVFRYNYIKSIADLSVAEIDTDIVVSRRALPNAPNGYTSTNVSCPANRPSIRDASFLSRYETSWLKTRRNETIQPMKDFLSWAPIPSFDAASYINEHASNISELISP